MEFIRGLCNLDVRQSESVCTIGAFDGVHLGHQKVLRHLRECAIERKAHSVVVTLEPLPRELLNPQQAPTRIHGIYQKCATLRTQDIDTLLCVRFNRELSEVPAEDFIVDVFVRRLNMRHMVVGDDLRFGHRQRGDFALLERLGAEHNFTVERTPTFDMEGDRVSSTRIRSALEKADFDLAAKLLGRPFTIEGKVIRGKRLGHTLGFPTANVRLHHRCAVAGVHVATVEIDGDTNSYQAVVNVGKRPTLTDDTKPILEAHLLDYDGDLYRRKLKVSFKEKLRSEQQFDSVEQLRERIAEDVRATRAYFAK